MLQKIKRWLITQGWLDSDAEVLRQCILEHESALGHARALVVFHATTLAALQHSLTLEIQNDRTHH
jgi:hypothetical protein